MYVKWRYFMSLAPIDEKLFTFYILEIFTNIFLSIGTKDMKSLPFDSYCHSDSNKLYFTSLQSLNSEILQINIFELEPFEYFWQVGVHANIGCFSYKRKLNTFQRFSIVSQFAKFHYNYI